ncbi:MAG: hypothetical protein IJW59_03330 [Clostridia bacterium]|nr:hypothetical protein [Clostridia bacterium]
MSNKKNYQSKIDEIINSTFEQIKNVIDANTVVGTTIKLSENIFVIPISKVSVGIVSGGGEDSKKKNGGVSAGSTSGFTITPMGFVTIRNDDISFVGVTTENNITTKLFESAIMLSEKVFQKLEEENEK